MAKKSDWIFKLPVATRSALAEKMLGCFKKVGITQKELRKLVKTDPKKAKKIKRKLFSCLTKRPKKR